MSSQPPSAPQTGVSQPQPQLVAQLAQWSGPLPPPAALEHFERIIPGGANRILSLVEKEQANRVTAEKKALDAQIDEGKRGQQLGALIAILAVGGAVLTAIFGAHWSVSVALVSVPVLGMVQAIARKAPQPPERK